MFEINDIEWYIKFVPYNDPMLLNSQNQLTLGCCDNNTHIIYLNNNLTNYKLKKVLCHELTHAAMFSYSIFLSIEQEELLADLIATYGQEIIQITNKIFNKIKQGY